MGYLSALRCGSRGHVNWHLTEEEGTECTQDYCQDPNETAQGCSPNAMLMKR
jgi:hypothetical protein